MSNAPVEILETLIGKSVPDDFGKPLLRAFKHYMPDKSSEAVVAAAFVCMLYLSHTKYGFPLYKLRKYYYNVKADVAMLSFDCKSYDKILEYAAEDVIYDVPLITSSLDIQNITISIEELREALDFYTNQ